MNQQNKLQMLVAEIQGTAESEVVGAYKQIPFRVRIDLLARLEALNDIQSVYKKTPRNNLLNDLLEIAMEQVVSQLDDETSHELDVRESHYYHELENLND